MAAPENKTSFVFQQSFYEAIKRMDDATHRACMDALCEYAFEGKEPETSGNAVVYMFMSMARPLIDAAAKRYAASVENGKKGAKYGILGGRPRKSENPTKTQGGNPTKTQGGNPTKTQGENLLNDNVDVDVEVEEEEQVDVDNLKKEKISKKKKFFKDGINAPTFEEIEAYFREEEIPEAAREFYDYNNVRGWRLKDGSKIYDWRPLAQKWAFKEKRRRSVRLGVGEFINDKGERTYGDGSIIIPDNAPIRTSTNSCYNRAGNNWIVM